MAVFRSQRNTCLIVALTLAAGAAQGVWAPRASTAKDCPAGQPACTAQATTVERKNQAQASDLVTLAPAQPTARNVTVFRQTDNEQECEICVDGDQVRATINAQPVEARLIEREGNQIRLMSPDGQQRMIVRVSPEGHALMQHTAPGATQRQGGVIARRVAPGHAPIVVEGHPGAGRTAVRVQRQRDAQPQAIIERRALGSHMIPPPPVPGAPEAPQVRIQRRHADGSAQTNTIQIERVPGVQGQFRVRTPQGAGRPPQDAPRIMQRVAPGAPAQPGAGIRVRPPQPPAPPAPPHAGGQVMIQRDGQAPQILDLGQFMHRPGSSPDQPQTFTLPGGGRGQVRVFAVPGAQGNAQTYQLHVQSDDDADDACCDDCAQDGSCCECGAPAPQAPQRRGQGGAPSGQIIIDTGHGQPQVIELDNLGQIHAQLAQHFGQLGHARGLNNLHEHLLHLQDIDGLESLHGLLQGLDMDDISAQIEVELGDALSQIEGHVPDANQLQIEIQGAIEDALEGFDFDTLSGDIQAQVRAALAESGIQGLDLDEGEFTFQTAPALFQGALAVEVDDDDQPAAQPRARARNVTRPTQVEVVPQVRGLMTTPGTVTTFGEMVQQPRVMLGITMGEAPAETLEHLRIDGAAIRIDRVIDGLPAAEAGLKAGAIIIAINGESPATTALLRECLAACEPGDTITVDVVERGARKQIEIELAAYDAQALSLGTGDDNSDQGIAQTWTFEAPTNVDQADLQARIRQAVESMTASGVTQIDPEALRAQIEALVRDHVAQFEGMHAFTGQRAPGRVIVAPGAPHAGHGQSGQMLFVQPDAPTAPAAPAAPDFAERRSPNYEQRLNELSERMSRLEQRLDRLMQMMEQRGQRD